MTGQDQAREQGAIRIDLGAIFRLDGTESIEVADHILVARGAVLCATRRMARFQVEMGEWAPLSLSTGFDSV